MNPKILVIDEDDKLKLNVIEVLNTHMQKNAASKVEQQSDFQGVQTAIRSNLRDKHGLRSEFHLIII